MMSGVSAVTGLVIAVFILIFLVLRTRVHPLIAMIAAASVAGLTAGMSVSETLDSITRGFGSTLGSIGLVIGLGVMMGRILEVSGAAEQIARSFIRTLGNGKEAWAMMITGYFVSIPIFVDSAFVILFPVARALARSAGRPVVPLGIALAGGLVVTHTLVPPTPGPLAAAGLFGTDTGAMMLTGMILAIPCVIAFGLYARWIAHRFPCEKIPENSFNGAPQEPEQERRPPGLLVSWLPIAVPILLILIKAVSGLLPAEMENAGSVVFKIVDFLGTPVIALSVSTLIAVYGLVPHLDRRQTNLRLEEGLQSAGIILLVTGAGGALGAVVRESGTGALLAEQVSHLPVSPVMIPFFVATAVRLIQGSGTVACITAASITAPVLAAVPGVNMLIAAQSAVAGALCFSYFNDSLFWVVNRMMGISDVRQQIMVWSVPTTLAWAVGGMSVALLNLATGAPGSWRDPVFPLIVMGVILLFVRWRR